MTKVSIIIPTFNRCALLPRAVESARHAYSGPVEIVIVDDASTDETANLCVTLENVLYLRQIENRGLAAARNAGFEGSSGEYLVFLDDDDELLPGALDAGIETLDNKPHAGLYYGQVRVRRPDGSIAEEPFPGRCPEGDVFWEFMTGFGPCPHACIVRRTSFKVLGGFDSRLRHFEDLDLWTRLAERYQVAATMREVGVYREATAGSGQLSSGTSRRAHLGLAVHSTWLELPRAKAAPTSRRAAVRRRFLDRTSDLLLFAAAAAVTEGEKSQARSNVLTALRLHPRRALRPSALKLLWRTVA